MKKRIIGIVVFLVLIGLGSAWYFGTFRQLGFQNKSFSWTEHIAREEARREAAQKRADEEAKKPRIYQPPQWPASSTIDWSLRNQLPKELVEKIDQSPVPVLVPGDAKYGQKAIMMISTYHSNFLYNQGDREYLDFDILANPTTDSRTIPGNWKRKVRGVPAQFIHGYDDSWRLQWFENGILYYLDLTCHPEVCKDESFVFSLAESLRYVGGKNARGGTE